MVNTVAKVRLVRCPKCLKLLPEFADVPMYQCGGCGSILRAKNYSISKESASTLGSPVTVTSRSISDNESSSDGLSSTMQNIDLSSLNHGEESGTIRNRSHEEGELLATDESKESSNDVSCSTEERDADNSSLLGFSSKDEDKEEEEEEKPSNLSNEVSGEQILNREHEDTQSNKFSSPASSSSSSSNERVPEKYRLMSRRTFRSQPGSSSDISKAKEGGGDIYNASKQKRMASLGSESFYSVQSLMEPENEVSSRSLSKDLQYVKRNSFGHQNESNSMRLKNLNQNRVELIKLVEELKDQLGKEYAQKSRIQSSQMLKDQLGEEYAQKSRIQFSQMPRSYLHPHLKVNEPIQPLRKSRPLKRFYRPVLGGAPFVICYKCFEMLHMPADFLISKKTLNKLKCGFCSEILLLPFPARDYPVPQASSVENGNCSEGPISYSEEYGVSCTDSSSADAEPVLNVSGVSSNEGKNGKDLGLPLHRIMGYASARFLLY